jgi:ferredoxin
MSLNAPSVLFIGHAKTDTQADTQQFDAWSNQPLLLSMEQGGINWPSSCRNGTCRTCFSKLKKGQVRYEIDWPGLSAEEKEGGYILPCVAHPCTDVTMQFEGF